MLRETGNARAAAEAIGMDPSTLRSRRRKDPAFQRDHEEAIAAADARLGGEEEIETDPFEAIRQGPDGRLQIVAVGKGRWTGAVEQRFFALLRENGNMSASARAVGFTPETIWERRRKWPAFAEAIEAVLDDAEIVLELRLATQGNNVVAAEETEGTVMRDSPQPQPFDPEFALKFLKWREEKRGGGGRRGRGDRQFGVRTLDEVRASILHKLSAIHRHRQQQAEKGQEGDGE